MKCGFLLHLINKRIAELIFCLQGTIFFLKIFTFSLKHNVLFSNP